MSSYTEWLKSSTPTGTTATTNAYQSTMYKPQNQFKWYAGDKPTEREALSMWMNMANSDRDLADKFLSAYRREQQIPGSNYYNPHTKATNSAVEGLKNMGLDVSNIGTDEWFDRYSWLQQYYNPSDATNKATKPGKNASEYEQAAYYYNQAYDVHEATKKTNNEVAAIRKEIQWMVDDPNRNWTDDEIVNTIKGEISGKKYSYLNDMEQGRVHGEPVRLNTAIEFSQDGLYGMVWAARNPNPDGTYGTKSWELNTAMYMAREGNQYVENPEIRAKLDPEDSAYLPYSLGSTAQELCLYFGVYSLDRDYLNSIRDEVKNSGDQTKIDNFNAAWGVMEHTEKLDSELDAMHSQIDRLLKKDKLTPNDIINVVYSNSDYSDLFELDATMDDGTGEITKLVPTAWAVDYKRANIENEIRQKYAENHKKEFEDVKNLANTFNQSVFGNRAAEGSTSAQPNAMINPAEIEVHADNRARTAPIVSQYGTQAEKNAMYGAVTGSDMNTVIQAQQVTLGNMTDPRRNFYLHAVGNKVISASEATIFRNQSAVNLSVNAQDEIDELTVQGQQQRQGADTAFNAFVQSAGVTDTAEIGAMKTAMDNISTDFLAAFQNRDVNNGADNIYFNLDADIDIAMDDLDDVETLVECYATYLSTLNYYNQGEGIAPGTDILWDKYQAYREGGDLRADILSAEDLANPEIQAALENAKATFQVLDGFRNDETRQEIASYIENTNAANETDSEIKQREDTIAFFKPRVDQYNRAISDMTEAIALSEADGSRYDAESRLGAIAAIPKISETEIPKQWQAYTYYQQKYQQLKDNGEWNVEARNSLIKEAQSDAISITSSVRNVREMVAELEENGVQLSDRQKKNIDAWCEEELRQAKWAYYYSLQGNDDFNEDLIGKTIEDAKNNNYDALAYVIANGPDALGHTLGHELLTNIVGTAVDLIFGWDTNKETPYKMLGNDPMEVALTLSSLTENEKDTYFYLLGSPEYGEKAATEYIRTLMDPDHGPMLVRNSEELKRQAQEMAESGGWNAVIATTGSMAANLLSIPTQIAETFGNDYNPYSAAFLMSDLRDAWRQGSKNYLHKKFGDDSEAIDLLYDALVSGAGDSMVMGAVTTMGLGAIAKVAKAVPEISAIISSVGATSGKVGTFIKGALKMTGEFAHAVPMGLGAATNAYRDAYIRSGGNVEMAEKMATVTFLAETVSEAVTFSNMHGMFKAGEEEALGSFKEWFKSFIKDTAQEVLGESMNELAEAEADKIIMGAYSNYNSDVQYFMDTLGCSKEEAERLADEKMWKGVLNAGLSAIVSSGFTEGGSYAVGRVVNTAATNRLGGDILKGGNDRVTALKDIAAKSGNKQLAEAAQSLEKDGKISRKRVGKFAAELLASDDENVSKQARAVLGMNNEQAAQAARQIQQESAQEAEQQSEQAPAPEGQQSPYWTSAEGWRSQRSNDLALLLSGKSDTTNSGEAAANLTNVLTGTAVQTGITAFAAKAAATTIINQIADGDSSSASQAVRSLLEESYGPGINQTKEAVAYAALTNGKANEVLTNIIRKTQNGAELTYDDTTALRSAMQEDMTGEDAAQLQETYDNNVQESEIAGLVMDKVNSGEIAEAVKGEQNAVESAEETVQNTQDEVDRTTREADASAKNLVATGEEYVNQPVAGGTTETPFQNAMAKHVANVNQKTQAEQARQNAQEKLDAAKQELEGKAKQEMNTARAEAKAAVDAENQARAQAEAEQEAKVKEEAEYQQALYDSGIVAQESSEESGRPASYEETQAKNRARFDYENGTLTYKGPNSEAMDQELEKAGFHREETVNMETGEEGYVYTANREDVKFADVKRLNDMVNQQEDEQTGKAQEDRENALIEQVPQAEALEGIEAENRVDELKEQRDKVKIKLRNLSKPLTDSEADLALHDLERRLGMKIVLEDMGPITKERWTRGKYANGVITLNKNLTIGQALVEAALHEITHSMKNTKSYQSYRDIVLKSVFKGTGDVNSLYESNADFRAKVDATINERLTAGDSNFVGKTHPEQIAAAEDEIIADFARLNLAEKDVVQRFVDAGLGGKMRNVLHNINQTLKNYLSGMSKEERQQAEYFRRAERAFQKAIDEVSRKSEHPEGGQFSIMQIAQATNMTFNEDTLQLYDKDGNEIDGVNRKVTPEMIKDTPVAMLINTGLSDQSPGVDEDGNRIDSPREAATKMMAGLMNLVARYKDSNLVWEIGATTLNSTFSALKSNSDPQYKTTVDFGTVCAKTQAIIDTLSQVMLDRVKEGKYGGLTRKDIMKVYDAVNKAGLSVPCPVCYVFSRWMGVPSLLGQMSRYQHDYVATNEDGTINKEKTQENVDNYIKNAEERYGDAKAINSQKTKLQNKQTKLEEKRVELEARQRDKGLTAEEKEAIQKQLDAVLDEQVEVDNQLGEVSAYNWITQALCKKDSSGKFVVDDKFRITPDEILFDLNRTGEFAGYEKNWRYRNTRGAGMGKAIMPYSGETIGDILFGVKKVGRQSTIKNPWLNNDDAAAAKQLREAQARAIKQNLVGGQRLQSTSDFRPEWGLDYIMSFLELQAAGSKVQMYTKVADAVDLFASVGADVNLSIMGKGQGWHEDENGNKVLDFSSVTGMDYETAKALKDKYDNVQMILVGMNDTHIRLALANSDIDFVIPWHSSGNSKDVISGLMATFKETLENGHNYEDSQNDTVNPNRTEEQKALWDARMKLLTKGGKSLTEAERKMLLSNPITANLYKRFTTPKGSKGYDAECYNVKLSKEQANQIFPYEYWDTSLTKDQADENGKRFVAYCEALGLVPRFSQFKDDTGYWKLLIDRPMYNNDGTYHQQQVIDVTKARIGNLDDSGKLENSDLPTSAQAKYAPKDPRNANYEQYTAAQQQAIENAEAMIDNRYDDGSEGSLSVYGEMSDAEREMLNEADNDIRYSNTGELSEADKKLMRNAGLDVSADERVLRQEGQQEKVNKSLSSWDDGSEKTLPEVIDLIGKSMYKTLDQWLHNTYQKGPKKGQKISRTDIESFIEQDAKSIVQGAESLVNGLSGVIKDHSADDIVHDLDHPDGEKVKTIEWNDNLSREKNIANNLFANSTLNIYDGPFSKNKRGDYNNLDTNAKIRIDDNTVNETLHRADREGNSDKANIILSHADELIRDAIYIGSHTDYAHPDRNAYVHYLVADTVVDGKNNAVIFAVHDPLQNNAGYEERTYIVEMVTIQEQKEGAPGDHGESEDSNMDLTRQTPSTVTINDVLKNVNTDRLRFFDKESLNSNLVHLSNGGELTSADEAMLNKTLIDTGVLTQEEVNRYNAMMNGEDIGPAQQPNGPQRQFGNKTAQESDELDEVTKRYLYEHSTYTPDTNQEQIERAVKWIRDGRMYEGDDGFQTALQKVTGKRFNSQTPDGQARTLATLAMAVAKGDVTAQIAIADAYNREGTTAGQTLQSRKIFRLMTPEGRIATLRKMLTDEQSRLNAKGIDVDLKFSNWIYRAAANATQEGDFQNVRKAAAQEIAEQVPSNWREKIQSIRMLSMLANPRTHVRNIIGNALFIPAVSIKNKLGAVAELGMKEGNRTKTLAPVLSKDVRAFANEIATKEKDNLTGESKYNEENLIEREKKPFKGFMQALIDLNSNALEAEDWFFLKGHFRRAFGGWMQANGYTVDQVRNDSSLMEQGVEYAKNEAQKATYRDFSKLAATLNGVSRNGGVAGFLVDAALPFKKTPANIMKRGIEYSPVGILKSLTVDMYRMKQYQDAVKNGTEMPAKAMSPNQVIDDFCAGLSGSAIMAVGMLLASIGAASVGLDDDDDKFDKLNGMQEYAINPGKAVNDLFGVKLFGEDVTYTMDWAAPMSMPFFVGVAIQKQREDQGEFDIEEAMNALASITEPVFNLSMLDGVNSLFKTSQYDDTNEITQIGAKILSNYASSYLPSIAGSIARAIDENRRMAFVESGKGTGPLGTFRYAYEQAQNKVPIWGKNDNIPYRDVWGNPETSSLGERLAENFLSPGYIQGLKSDVVVDELERLYNATSDSGMIPKDPGKTITLSKSTTDNPRKITLTAEQWDAYKVERGQTAYNTLKELMQNPYYLNATEAEQADMVNEVWKYANQQGIKVVASDYTPEKSYGKDPVQTIINERKTSDAKAFLEGKKSTKSTNIANPDQVANMLLAIEQNDFNGFGACQQALYDDGIKDETIKGKISDKYRDRYKQAYLEDDIATMYEIEDKLTMTGYKFDFKAWKKSADEIVEKEDNNSSYLRGSRMIASAGMSDVSFTGGGNNKDTTGQYGEGNIDLNNRQIVRNGDGSISTELSFSFYDEDTGKEVLIPTVINGQIVSEDEAIEHYYQTGEYLGMFDTPEEANEYADMLHRRQDWYYNR